MSEKIYEVDLMLEVGISVNAKSLEEAQNKIERLSNTEIINILKEQEPFLDKTENISQSFLSH